MPKLRHLFVPYQLFMFFSDHDNAHSCHESITLRFSHVGRLLPLSSLSASCFHRKHATKLHSSFNSLLLIFNTRFNAFIIYNPTWTVLIMQFTGLSYENRRRLLVRAALRSPSVSACTFKATSGKRNKKCSASFIPHPVRSIMQRTTVWQQADSFFELANRSKPDPHFFSFHARICFI